MARRDIPFERFYYDLRLRSFVYHTDDDRHTHFAEMEKVDRDDLQSLSKYELDIVPMCWLFDWAKVTGDCEFAEQVFADRKARGINYK